MADVSVLDVALNRRRIGTLTLLPGDQTLFAFDEAYIDDGERPTLSLSFKDSLGGLISDQRPVRQRVPLFFSNLLPERPLREYHERASYRNIAEVLWAETGAEDVAEYIRRLVFNALIGNADMHIKNWSLIYPDGRQAALSPGYDFVPTIAYLADTNMALTLGRSKAMTDLSLDQLSYLAAKARLPEKLVLDTAHETVQRFMGDRSASAPAH